MAKSAKTSRKSPGKSDKRLTKPGPVFAATLGNRGRRLNTPESYRRPSQVALLQRYFRWAHRCITINSQTAASICPRLFVIGSKGMVEKTHSLKPKPLDARTKAFLRGRAYLKPGSVASKKLAGNIDDMTEITEHPALMLLDNVNEWEEGFGFRESWYTDLQLFGRFFTSVIADPSDVPIALWRMFPHYTRVLPDVDKFVAGFEYGIGAEKKTFTPDEVFWVKLNDPMSPWDGLSPTEAWLKSLDADNSMVAFQEWIFNRGGTPDVLVVSKAGMTPEQQRIFRKDWRRMFGNMSKREESVGFVSGETEIVDLGGKPRDMEFTKGREISRDEICNAYGVPKALVTTDDVNLANAREGSISHKRDTIWPMIQRVEDALNQRLLKRWSDRLVLIHDNPIQEDREIRIQERKSKLESGWSVNETRLEDGEEPLNDPHADMPMVANNLVPLSMAGQSQLMTGLDGLPVAGNVAKPPGSDEADAPPGGSSESPDATKPATAKDAALPPVPLQSGLDLYEAYYGHLIPREAAVILAQSALRMTPEQAEAFLPELPPDAPMSEQQQQEHDANMAVQDATAAGKLKPGAGTNRNPDGSKTARRRAVRGIGIEEHKADTHSGGSRGTMQGEAAVGLGGPGSVRSDDRAGDNHGDDVTGGVDEKHLETQSRQKRPAHTSEAGSNTDSTSTEELFNAWEGVDHNKHCDRTDILSKCWKIHLKAEAAPQEGLPDPGSVRGFKGRMDKVLRHQVDEIIKTIKDAETANAALALAIQVIQDPAWIERIAEAARPFLSRAIEIGGNFGMQKIADELPEAMGFDVSNPEVQRYVDRAAAKLATGVNQYTEIATRDLLGQGLQRGESIPELTKRVQDWAGSVGDAERGTLARAENIARSESARAYVKGEIAAWQQSGVVTGKQWLLAPDACEYCEAAAAEFETKAIGLNQAFFAQGHTLEGTQGGLMKLDYDDVDGPPLHPQCRCDLIPIIVDSE